MASPASSCPKNHLGTEIEIESPPVRPAFTTIDAASPAAAACTSTSLFGIHTPSSSASASSSISGAADRHSRNSSAASTSGAGDRHSRNSSAASTSGAADPGSRNSFSGSARPSNRNSTAASTSGAADPNNRNSYGYSVFLNHHGQDVKNTIASHIYHSLRSHGIQVFLDRPESRKGENFPAQIGTAIKNASIHVAIFSPRYSESKWCLNELVEMLNTDSDIIPVFYEVKPCELRQTDGRYVRGLQKLKKETHFSPATIALWRAALSEASLINGFELDAFNGDEGMLVAKVVEAVLRKIREKSFFVAKHPVGLHVKVKEFEDTVLLMQQQKQQIGEPQVVGIVGMCGVGKTVLARELFNRKRSYYDRSYFLSNISLYSCQNKRDFCIESIDEGIETLKMQLSSFNAIVVLDGVDHVSQMDAFLPLLSVLGPNSLILITSRNKDVLTGSGFQNASIYKLTNLNAEYSRQLFCFHAFGYSHPLPGFELLVEKFVETCQGSPSSLKLSGELVCGKSDLRHWEDQLAILPQTLLHDIRDRLKSSYSALHRDEKEVFLDIAIFFIGERVDMAIRIWDALGLKGSLLFQNLVNKSLVELDSNGKIKMYNPVRDMAREIAEEPSGSPLRLWSPSGSLLRLWSRKQVDHLLQQSSGRTEVRGIRTRMDDDDTDSGDDSTEMSCYRKLFCKRAVRRCNSGTSMRNVHFLDTEGGQLKRILRRGHSSNPIWLRCLKCPYKTLPSCVPLQNLRVLEVSGCRLQRLWQDKSQAPLLLRELVIDSPLSKLPENIGLLEDLELIVLRNTNLKSLPQSFGNLKKLKYLDLSHSPSLQKLPNSLGNLRNLEHLDLSCCNSLQELPNSFGELAQLKHLDLSCSFSLKTLPNSFGDLTNLEHLNLSYSQSLPELPNSFSHLTQLKRLDLSNSSSLQKLPKSFANLNQLDYLDFSGCPNLIVSGETLPNIRPSSLVIPIEALPFQVIDDSIS